MFNKSFVFQLISVDLYGMDLDVRWNDFTVFYSSLSDSLSVQPGLTIILSNTDKTDFFQSLMQKQQHTLPSAVQHLASFLPAARWIINFVSYTESVLRKKKGHHVSCRL